MRYSALLGIAAIPLLVLAQDKFKIEPKWTKGEKSNYIAKFDFLLADADAKVTGTMFRELKEEGKLVGTYEGIKVNVNGSDMEYPSEPSDITLDKNGFLKSITGGIEGGDTARMYLASSFVAPPQALAKNETWKLEVPKSEAAEMGKIVYEAKYLGAEEPGHKYSTTLKEDGNEFSIENTVWVDANGKILKLEGTFKNMPVPAANSTANGKHSIVITK